MAKINNTGADSLEIFENITGVYFLDTTSSSINSISSSESSNSFL